MSIPDESLESRAALERWCDDKAEASAVVLGGYSMSLSTKDKSLTPHLVREGYWESWVSLAVARHVKPGMYCVDAGANVGYYTLLMVDRGATRVISIEPSPDTAELLLKTVRANGLLGKVEVSEVALGSSKGEGKMLTFGSFRGSDSLYPSTGYEVTSSNTVRVEPLDLIVGHWSRVDFVKVDVEGYEKEVWEGMEFIRKWNPDLVVCMEVSVRPEYDTLEFLTALASEKRLGIVEEDGFVNPASPMGVMEHPMMVRDRYIMVWLS